MQENININIISEIKSGNRDVFQLFYRAEFCNIVYFINKYIYDNDSAKDIAQESFISLWNYREKLDDQKNIRALIYTIAKNKALNYLRSNFIQNNSPINDELLINFNSLASDYVSNNIESLELNDIITKIYESLPPTYKESFLLSRNAGLTYEQIAERKGVSVKAIEYHISQALKIIRKKLAKYNIYKYILLFILISFLKFVI